MLIIEKNVYTTPYLKAMEWLSVFLKDIRLSCELETQFPCFWLFYHKSNNHNHIFQFDRERFIIYIETPQVYNHVIKHFNLISEQADYIFLRMLQSCLKIKINQIISMKKIIDNTIDLKIAI